MLLALRCRELLFCSSSGSERRSKHTSVFAIVGGTRGAAYAVLRRIASTLTTHSDVDREEGFLTDTRSRAGMCMVPCRQHAPRW